MLFALQGLTKKYGATPVLDQLTLSLLTPGIYGVVGANGSGKSTLLNILSGLLRADEGEIYVHNDRALDSSRRIKSQLRAHLGVLFQGSSSDDKLTAQENLHFYGRLKVLNDDLPQEVSLALTRAHLTGDRHRRVKEFSGGMKRRLELYRAFMGNPWFMVLDEPCEGLDYQEIKAFLEFVRHYQERHNALIIMASHQSMVLEQCHEVIMMHQGRIAGRGAPKELLDNLDYVVLRIDADDQGCEQIKATFLANIQSHRDGVLRLAVPSAVAKAFVRDGWALTPGIRSFAMERPTIHDALEAKFAIRIKTP